MASIRSISDARMIGGLECLREPNYISHHRILSSSLLAGKGSIPRTLTICKTKAPQDRKHLPTSDGPLSTVDRFSPLPARRCCDERGGGRDRLENWRAWRGGDGGAGGCFFGFLEISKKPCAKSLFLSPSFVPCLFFIAVYAFWL